MPNSSRSPFLSRAEAIWLTTPPRLDQPLKARIDVREAVVSGDGRGTVWRGHGDIDGPHCLGWVFRSNLRGGSDREARCGHGAEHHGRGAGEVNPRDGNALTARREIRLGLTPVTAGAVVSVTVMAVV